MKSQEAHRSRTSLNSGSGSTDASEYRSPVPYIRPLTVMGLDLSLGGTGLVVRVGDKVRRWRLLQTEGMGNAKSHGLLASGKFRGTSEARIEWSVGHIRKAWRKFQPDLVVIEEYAFGAKGKGLSILHEQGGVVKNFLYRVEAPFVTVHNSQIKLHATGKGGASKEEMIEAAASKWPRFPKDLKGNDNVADAYHLADWGFENYRSLVYEGD